MVVRPRAPPWEPPPNRKGGGAPVNYRGGTRPAFPGSQLGPSPHPANTRRHTSYASAAGSTKASFNNERDAYEAIIRDAKAKRNTILIKSDNVESGTVRGNMSNQEWADLIFDQYGIKMEEVSGIDFQAGSKNFLAAEIHLKKGVDPTRYSGKCSVFNGRKFEAKRERAESTKVIFKSVPEAVPDAELVHLVKSYGGKMVSEEIQHEIYESKTTNGIPYAIPNGTRYVHATFPPNRRMRRFYWLQGPLPRDPLRRIVVEHSAQIGRECGHCLRNSADPIDPCNYNGKTSACREYFFEGRLTLSKYFKKLKEEDGYASLKTQYMWNVEEDDLTTQMYSDEFVNSGDFDEEMELEQDDKEASNAATANKKGEARMGKEAATLIGSPTPPDAKSATPASNDKDEEEENNEGAPHPPEAGSAKEDSPSVNTSESDTQKKTVEKPEKGSTLGPEDNDQMEEADGGNKKSPVCKDGEAKLEDDSPPTPATSNSEEAKPTLAANVNTSKIPTSKKKEEAKKEAVGGGPSPSHSPLTGKDTKGPAKDPGKKSKAPGGKDKASGRTSEVTPEALLVIGPSMLLHEQRRNCLSQAAGIINDGANFQASLASSAMNLSLHLDSNDFRTNDKGEIMEAEGRDPWRDLKQLIATKPKPKANKQVQDRLNKLKEAVKDILHNQANTKSTPRTRSVSRNRSEDGEDKEEIPAKAAKLEEGDGSPKAGLGPGPKKH